MLGQSSYLPATPVDPVTLSTGADGYFYNYQDLTSLRQDNTDTAAAVNQPVGMIFDRWVPNTLGSNIVTNGDFPTNTTGWTAASATLSVVSARMRVANSGAAAGRAYQSLTTLVGNTYKVTIDLVTNANGAAIAVGTTNSTSTLFLLSIPAGTTGSYTFYFQATTTTSFIQLRTTSTTTGHFTEWDNVVCKSIAGRHIIIQTSTVRPILRYDGIGYYLENDGIDDVGNAAATYTIQLPHYIATIIQRMDSAINVVTTGIRKNATNYHLMVLSSSLRADGNLREGTIGAVAAPGTTNTLPNGRKAAIDSLSVVGTTDACVDRRLPNTIANSWLAGTQITQAQPGVFSGGAGTALTQVLREYARLGMCQDPGASRAGIRAYLANFAGAD